MPQRVKGRKRTLHAAELNSRTEAVIKEVRTRGGRGKAVDNYTNTNQDMNTKQRQLTAWHTVAAVKKDGLVMFEDECNLWLKHTTASVHKLNFQPTGPCKGRIMGSGDCTKLSVRTANRRACHTAPLMDYAASRGCKVILEQSEKPTLRKYRPIRAVLKKTQISTHDCTLLSARLVWREAATPTPQLRATKRCTMPQMQA